MTGVGADCSGASVGSLEDVPVPVCVEAGVCATGVDGAGDDAGCVDAAPVGTLPEVRLSVVLIADDDMPMAGTVWYNTWCTDGETMLVE